MSARYITGKRGENMDAIKEAVKEALRVILIAVIPVTIDGFMANEINLKLLFVAGVVAGLRFIDKWLHEAGKEKNNKMMEGGLTRF